MAMILKTDKRRRITIPPEAGIKAGDQLEMEVLPNGCILLVPMLLVPRPQDRAWTAKNRKKIAESLADPRPSIVIKDKNDLEELARRWDFEL
jgi:bifunctional DNA-binding transcriptional regulator/antitoxin component of YhaV-PrlF toxin-antitoxin module